MSRFDSSVTFSIEAGFGSLPASTGITWTAIDTYAKTVEIERGRSALFSQFDAGTATIILDNRDGRFDPNNTGSPYDPNVKVSTPIRVKAVHSGTTYHLFRGIAESWPVTYPEVGKDSVVTLSCVDEFKALNLADIGGSTFALALADDRIADVLTAIDWPSTRRALEVGSYTTPAVTMDPDTPALGHIQAVAEGDYGAVFMSAEGDVTYHTRTHFSGTTAGQAVFGGGSTELPFVDIRPNYDDDYLWNVAKVTRDSSDAVEQTAQSTGSIDDNWRRTYVFTGPFHHDAEALNLAEWIVDVYSEVSARVDGLSVLPRSDTDLWPAVLGLELRDAVRVKHNPIGAGSNFNRLVTIEGISHAFTPGKEWVTSYTLGPLSTMETQNYWQIGSTSDDLGTASVLA